MDQATPHQKSPSMVKGSRLAQEEVTSVHVYVGQSTQGQSWLSQAIRLSSSYLHEMASAQGRVVCSSLKLRQILPLDMLPSHMIILTQDNRIS